MKTRKPKFPFSAFFILLLLIPIYCILFADKLIAGSDVFTEPINTPRIGLLGDTQITTDKGETVFAVRSKFADKFVEVAIRPPALEHLDEKIQKNEPMDTIMLSISEDDESVELAGSSVRFIDLALVLGYFHTLAQQWLYDFRKKPT